MTVLLSLLLSWAWAQGSADRQLILGIGQKTAVAVQGDLLLGPEKVLKATDLGSKYQIEGLKPGHTELRTGGAFYDVSVLSQDQLESWKILQQSEKSTLALKTRVDQGTVWLEGKLTTFKEWRRIAAACEFEHCHYRSRFHVPEALRARVQARIGDLLRKSGFGSGRLRWEPQIELITPTPAKSTARLTGLLEPYGIEVVVDPSALELAPSVRAQIAIIEMRKDESEKYGLQWPTSYSTQILPKGGDVDQMILTAQFLETHGLGKVLASPSLLCRSGKESDFLAGGEIPVKIINFKMQDVMWKTYGIILKLKPQADFSGRMSIEIETEVSTIDTSHTVDGTPGFLTNRAHTHFDLSEPRTIALSGLLKSEETHSSEGLLGLSQLPILGPLFSSRDFQANRTELVILVRPEVVSEQESEQP